VHAGAGKMTVSASRQEGMQVSTLEAVPPRIAAPRFGAAPTSDIDAFKREEESSASKARQPVGFADAHHVVHALLFMLEFSNSTNPLWQRHKQHLSFFFRRHGGLHLLLMLLNAHFNKPAVGRRPGWVFSGLRHRLGISERGLRMLIRDAMAAGLVEQQPLTNELDKRCRSYRLKPQVVDAWEALISTLNESVGDVLGNFDPGALANADYRRWDPTRPAQDQIERLPPSHPLRRGG